MENLEESDDEISIASDNETPFSIDFDLSMITGEDKDQTLGGGLKMYISERSKNARIRWFNSDRRNDEKQ